jgi:hypothetical protein
MDPLPALVAHRERQRCGDFFWGGRAQLCWASSIIPGDNALV